MENTYVVLIQSLNAYKARVHIQPVYDNQVRHQFRQYQFQLVHASDIYYHKVNNKVLCDY